MPLRKNAPRSLRRPEQRSGVLGPRWMRVPVQPLADGGRGHGWRNSAASVTRPTPSSAGRRSAMTQQRTRHTAPELLLRRELHRRGLRYRLHRSVLPGLRRTADIVFVGARVVVDVRGCFWHGCPDHTRLGTSNTAWWRAKLAANTARDEETERLLVEAGWRVVVVWEHEPVTAAATRVEQAVRLAGADAGTR